MFQLALLLFALGIGCAFLYAFLCWTDILEIAEIPQGILDGTLIASGTALALGLAGGFLSLLQLTA